MVAEHGEVVEPLGPRPRSVIAVEGAVVSKPMAMNTTRLPGLAPGDLQGVQR